MDIEYKGGNSLIISSKDGTIFVDAKTSVVGRKDLNTNNSTELATEERSTLNNPEAKVSIESPGEFETDGFVIRGTAAKRHVDTDEDGLKSTIYSIKRGDIRLAIVGNIDAKLSDDQLESIGVVDILVLPVGGGGLTLDAMSAKAIVSSIDPKVVIPVHYADPKLKYEVPQEGVEAFIKELGAPVEETNKYKVKPGAVFNENLLVVKLNLS